MNLFSKLYNFNTLKTMKHKFLLFLMLLTATLTASASYITVDGISYTTNGNEATVNDAVAGDLVIPETVTYEGVTYSVTAIEEQAFAYRNNITSVTIPRSITSIKPNAFLRCTGLISVTIDNASTAIGYQAFANCFYLTNVDLGNAVTSIEQGAFAYCYEMMDVEIPNTVTFIGKYAFDACAKMTNLMIPSSVTHIDTEAFNSCSSLTHITVDKNNTHYDSRNLCNAIIETSTNTLIIGCTNTIIPNTVETISDNAFSSCKMRTVRIPNSVTSIGNYAFSNCSELTDVTIGNSVISIGEFAFFQCHNLTNLSIGNSVSTIGRSAFKSCYNLKYLNLPSSVTFIGEGAFEGCNLLGLTINSDLTFDQTSFDFDNLTNFTIGKSVTSIDISKFRFYEYRLDSVTCLATTPPTCISGFTDYTYSRATLFVPEESISAYENADCWKEFYYITRITNLPEEPSGYEMVSIDGFWYQLTYDKNDPMYSGTAAMLYRDYSWDIETGNYIEYQIQYEDWNTDSIFYIPSDIVTDHGVFKLTQILGGLSGASDLKTVVVPSTITQLRSYAFGWSSIESIYFCGDYYINDATPISFGGDLTYEYGYSEYDDGNSIFRGCERLSTVVFEKPIDRLPAFTFMDCSNLKSVYFSDRYFNPDTMPLDTIGDCSFFNCTGLTHFEVPNSVKVIGECAFAYCNNLESINLSDSLTTIKDHAFAECHQLQGVALKPSLQNLGEFAFIKCWSLSSISIPDKITTIKDYTFYDCRNLKYLELNNVTIFGEHSFAGCDKLPSIDLTKAQSIGEAAFFTGEVICYLSTEPNDYPPYLHISVCEEGWYPGNNEGSFKKITLGENVSMLNERTFYGHIPDTITCMASAPPVFSRTDNCDWVFSAEANQTTILRVPQALVNDYREAYGWSRFVNIDGIIDVEPGDIDGDGKLDIKDVTDLIDMLLSGTANVENRPAADVNGDGAINIADVTALIDKLLGL